MKHPQLGSPRNWPFCRGQRAGTAVVLASITIAEMCRGVDPIRRRRDAAQADALALLAITRRDLLEAQEMDDSSISHEADWGLLISQ